MSIARVAERAGVSNATISRVINRQAGVSASTVANVQRVMEEIGYNPPARRRGPKVGSKRSTPATNILFAVFFNGRVNTSTGFHQLVAAASSQFNGLNASVVVKFLSSSEETKSLNLTQSGIDGILAHGTPFSGGVPEELQQIPTVWLMGNPARPTWGDQVMPGNDEIGRIAAQYLINSGCDRLAYLNLVPDHWALHLRGRAFVNAAEELDAAAELIGPENPVTDQPFVDCGPDATGRITVAADCLVDELLSRTPAIDGVFIAEDAQAAILVPALQRRGVTLGVGGDLGLISCNNERPYLMGLNPCPATIDIRIESIARRGADQLMWRIAQRSNADRMCTTIEPRLISSGSSPRIAHRSTPVARTL